MSSEGRPNVLLILADDIGVEWLGCYGSEENRTPHLDALARQGMRFEHCYSLPLCTPSRVCLMTGRYSHRNYLRFGTFPPEDQAATIGNLMKQAGYATCMAGKWQLGKVSPEAMEFDEYLQYDVNQARQQNYYWNPTDETIENRIRINGAMCSDFQQGYGPDIVAKFITDFIDNHGTRPFFVYYPMLLCHAPFQPTPASADKDFLDEPKYSNKQKWYADMVSYMDTVIGRLVAHLEKKGLREETLILFTGDNGSPYTQARYRGGLYRGQKGQMNDAGTHVPLIANWPGTIEPDSVRTGPVDFSDFYATLAELANATPDEEVDGVSFVPQLLAARGSGRSWAFVFYTPNQSGKPDSSAKNAYWARTGRWKLYHDNRLFDMKKDSQEARPILPTGDTQESAAAREQLLGAFHKVGVSVDMLQ